MRVSQHRLRIVESCLETANLSEWEKRKEEVKTDWIDGHFFRKAIWSSFVFKESSWEYPILIEAPDSVLRIWSLRSASSFHVSSIFTVIKLEVLLLILSSLIASPTFTCSSLPEPWADRIDSVWLAPLRIYIQSWARPSVAGLRNK
jgi:hypothetical protein